MNKDYRQIHFGLVILVAFALLAYSCSGCRPGNKDLGENRTANEQINQSPAKVNGNSQHASPLPADSQVSQRNSNVTLATKQQNPQPLTDNNWHDLYSGDRIATDANGEAEVNIQNCMRVYVFRDSQLIRSACPKVASQSGNAYCAQAGTSLFNNSCANRLTIQTESAEITVEGTYFSITYLPAQELTFLLVFKGKVRVRPIANGEPSGEPVEVAEGQFLITVPEEKRTLVSQLDPSLLSGKPASLDRFREAVVTLKLQPWMQKIFEQARADQIRLVIPSPNGSVVPSPNGAGVNQSLIDCDCENISSGFTTGAAQRQCRAVENNLKAELARTGNVTGKCDAVASGPKARPR